MKIYTTTGFTGHYVGTAAVIVARDEAEALVLLKRTLAEHGLERQDWDEVANSLQPLNRSKAQAIILQDGNY